MTRRIPFYGISNDVAILLATIQGQRPDRPGHEITQGRLTDVWWTVCCSCWAADPKSRPSIHNILRAPVIVLGDDSATDSEEVYTNMNTVVVMDPAT